MGCFQSPKWNFALKLFQKTTAHRRYVDDVPQDVKADRHRRMMEAYSRTSAEYKKKMLGSLQLVLVEGVRKTWPSNAPCLATAKDVELIRNLFFFFKKIVLYAKQRHRFSSQKYFRTFEEVFQKYPTSFHLLFKGKSNLKKSVCYSGTRYTWKCLNNTPRICPIFERNRRNFYLMLKSVII